MVKEPEQTPETVDEYVSAFPAGVRRILQKIRKTIHKAAPGADESISYRIPTFKQDGKVVIYFAGFAKHVSVYPAPRAAKEFKAELSAYKGGKGTVQFPLDQAVPYGLITRIVKFRADQNRKAADTKRK
jgi:uncharacterized protein YdhG (YjbR/CyaY superfamily)